MWRNLQSRYCWERWSLSKCKLNSFHRKNHANAGISTLQTDFFFALPAVSSLIIPFWLFLLSFFYFHFSSLSPGRASCEENLRLEKEDVVPKDEKTRKYQIILIDFNKNRGNEKHFHRSAGFHIFSESNEEEEEDKGRKKVFVLFRFFLRCFHDLLST